MKLRPELLVIQDRVWWTSWCSFVHKGWSLIGWIFFLCVQKKFVPWTFKGHWIKDIERNTDWWSSVAHLPIKRLKMLSFSLCLSSSIPQFHPTPACCRHLSSFPPLPLLYSVLVVIAYVKLSYDLKPFCGD